MADEIEYRMVAGRDMVPVAAFLLDHGYDVPPAGTAIAFAAFDSDGDVIGALTFAAIPMVDALYVAEGHRDGIGPRLFRNFWRWVRESDIPRFYGHSAHPVMQKMIESMGGREVADKFYVAYRKEAEDVHRGK